MLAGTLYCPTTRRGLACSYSSACLPCICMDQTVNPSSIGTTAQGLPYWMPLQSSGPASKWAFGSTPVAELAAIHNRVLSHARHEEECRQPSTVVFTLSPSSCGLSHSHPGSRHWTPKAASLSSQGCWRPLRRVATMPEVDRISGNGLRLASHVRRP